MKKPMDSRSLIEDLQATLREQLRRAEQLEVLTHDRLEQRPMPDAWSVLEIVEHLNILSGQYLRRLRKAYAGSGIFRKDPFLPGRWNTPIHTAQRHMPTGRIPGPMRTLWFFDPKAAHAKGRQSLQDFRALLDEQAVLLDKALARGIEGPRITSTIGPILRFKIGDSFRFMIAHQQRHFLQIDRALATVAGKDAHLREGTRR